MPKPVYKKTVKKVAKKKVAKKKKAKKVVECIACGDTKLNSKGGPCAACRTRGWN